MEKEQNLLSPQPISKPLQIISHLQLNHFFHFLLFSIGLSLVVVTTSLFFQYTSSDSLLYYPFIAISSKQSTISKVPESLALSNTSNNNDTTKHNNNVIITTLMHNMSDDELFQRALSTVVSPEIIGQGHGKVAFMFMAIGEMPLAPLWEKFFKGHQQYYSIYLHHSDSSFNETLSPDSVFYGTTIPSQPVYWGSITMIDAERRLLANALLDYSNERFVLLSESCIPLFHFNTIYSYLVNSNLSFLGSFDDPGSAGRGRYNPLMHPSIELDQWRKSAQWFELRRDLALKVISDTKYYPIFRDHCHPGCYSDEHYLPTLVNIMYGNMSANRSLTWVDWSRGGAHPRMFWEGDITDELLNRIRFESGECEYNGNVTTICFLFARKFSSFALEPLLKVTPVLLSFDP